MLRNNALFLKLQKNTAPVRTDIGGTLTRCSQGRWQKNFQESPRKKTKK